MKLYVFVGKLIDELRQKPEIAKDLCNEWHTEEYLYNVMKEQVPETSPHYRGLTLGRMKKSIAAKFGEQELHAMGNNHGVFSIKHVQVNLYYISSKPQQSDDSTTPPLSEFQQQQQKLKQKNDDDEQEQEEFKYKIDEYPLPTAEFYASVVEKEDKRLIRKGSTLFQRQYCHIPLPAKKKQKLMNAQQDEEKKEEEKKKQVTTTTTKANRVQMESRFESTEFKRLFRPRESDDTTKDAVRNRMSRLSYFLNHSGQQKYILSGGEDDENPCTPGQILRLRQKSQLLLTAYYFAVQDMDKPPFPTWKTTCQKAIDHLGPIGLNTLATNSQTIAKYNLEFAKFDGFIHPSMEKCEKEEGEKKKKKKQQEKEQQQKASSKK